MTTPLMLAFQHFGETYWRRPRYLKAIEVLITLPNIDMDLPDASGETLFFKLVKWSGKRLVDEKNKDGPETIGDLLKKLARRASVDINRMCGDVSFNIRLLYVIKIFF